MYILPFQYNEIFIRNSRHLRLCLSYIVTFEEMNTLRTLKWFGATAKRFSGKQKFVKERYSSKQANILILKTILFISQNMFQSIHTSSSVAKSIIKTVNILNLHIS